MINRILRLQQEIPLFHASYLVLQPEQNSLAFLSCGQGTLLHLPNNQITPRILKSPESAYLGAEADPDLLKLDENWNMEDLVLFSPSGEIRLPQNAETLQLAPQPLAEALIGTCQMTIALKRLSVHDKK